MNRTIREIINSLKKEHIFSLYGLNYLETKHNNLRILLEEDEECVSLFFYKRACIMDKRFLTIKLRSTYNEYYADKEISEDTAKKILIDINITEILISIQKSAENRIYEQQSSRHINKIIQKI